MEKRKKKFDKTENKNGISNLIKNPKEGLLLDPRIASAGCYRANDLRPDAKGASGLQHHRGLDVHAMCHDLRCVS